MKKRFIAAVGIAVLCILVATVIFSGDYLWMRLQEARAGGKPKEDRLQLLLASYIRNDVSFAKAVDQFGIPDKALGYPGEIPVPGQQLSMIPAKRPELDLWFAEQSVRFVRIGLVWNGESGASYGMEFRSDSN